MRTAARQLSLGSITAIVAVAALVGAGCAARASATLDADGEHAASAAANDGWFVAPPAPVAKAPVARQVPNGRGGLGRLVAASSALPAAIASARPAVALPSVSPALATLGAGTRSIRGPPRA